MKDYTNSNPQFSETIRVVENTDPAYGDNIALASKQLLQNSLVNRNTISSLFGFVYDKSFEMLVNYLGCWLSESKDTVFIPDYIAKLEGETIIVTPVVPFTPVTPGGYVLPVATNTDLGGVIIGNGINVDSAGRISVDSQESAETAADIVERNATDYSNDEIDALFN